MSCTKKILTKSWKPFALHGHKQLELAAQAAYHNSVTDAGCDQRRA